MKLALSLVLILCSMSVSAAEPNTAKSKDDDGKDYVIAPKSVIRADSSEHNRINKNHQVNAILFGVGPSISSTFGLQYGYFLNRNQLIVVEATSGKLGTLANFDELFGYSYEIKTKSLGVHWKHFTGNSFYYRAGIDLRSADYSFSNVGDVNDYGKFKGTSVAANFQIGNQWQWSNFTLGCDWLGLSAPLTSTESDREVGSTAPSNANTVLDGDSESLLKRAHINILRFYLGASF